MSGTTCKNSNTVDYVIATKNVLRILQGFGVIDFCHFYSDVQNPISKKNIFRRRIMTPSAV